MFISKVRLKNKKQKLLVENYKLNIMFVSEMALAATKLKTIKNYAMDRKVTPAYIYKLIKDNKMKAVIIDGVQFINTEAYPTLPTR